MILELLKALQAHPEVSISIRYNEECRALEVRHSCYAGNSQQKYANTHMYGASAIDQDRVPKHFDDHVVDGVERLAEYVKEKLPGRTDGHESRDQAAG